MAKKYLDDSGQFSAVSAGTTYTLPAATAAALGGVKQGVKVTHAATGADAAALVTKLNELLTSLENAGIVAK